MALSADLTAKEFADLVGIGTRQVENLVVEGLPRVRRGKRYCYPAGRAVRWYIAHKLERARRERPGGRDSSAKDRKILAEAQLAELDVAEREKNLVSIDMFDAELSGILERMRARLLAAPQKFAPRIVGLRNIPEALVALEPCLTELMAECMRTADDVDAGDASPDLSPRLAHPPRRPRRAS